MSSYQLKIMGIILMVLDHIGFLFPTLNITIYLRIVGRVVAPIFFYLLVEGFFHTSNRKKYLNRLLFFSILMSIGNIFFISIIKTFNIQTMYSLRILCPNIFLSMFLSLKTLETLENLKNKKQISNLLLLCLYITLNFYTESSVYGIFMTFIFYFLRDKKIAKVMAYIFSTFIVCLLKGAFIQVFMVFAIIPILFYNGEKGRGLLSYKYFFYLFYMVHFWILIIISLII